MKIILLIAALISTNLFAQINSEELLVDTDSADQVLRSINDPVWQCACSTNAPNRAIVTVSVDSSLSSSAKRLACHEMEGKMYVQKLRRRGEVTGLTALLACEPRVISKDAASLGDYEPSYNSAPAPDLTEVTAMRETISTLERSLADTKSRLLNNETNYILLKNRVGSADESGELKYLKREINDLKSRLDSSPSVAPDHNPMLPTPGQIKEVEDRERAIQARTHNIADRH